MTDCPPPSAPENSARRGLLLLRDRGLRCGAWVLCWSVLSLNVLAPTAWTQTTPTAKPVSPAAVDPKTVDRKTVETKAGGKAEAGNTDDETYQIWQVTYIGNTRVGYTKVTSQPRIENGVKILETEAESVMVMQRFGQTIRTRTVIKTEETPEGELIGYRFEMLNPPAAPSRTVARVDGDKLRLDVELAGKMTKKELPWDRTVKTSTYQERMLRDQPLNSGDKRTLRVFDPQFTQVVTVQLKAGEKETVKLLNGKERTLQKVVVEHSALPAIPMIEYVDDNGESQLTTIALMKLSNYKTTKAEALKNISASEVDLAVSTLIKVPRIAHHQTARKIVYRLTDPGEDISKMLPHGVGQTVKKLGPHSAEVTLETILPPTARGPNSAPAAAEAAVLKGSVEATRFLQSDDPLVKKHAAAAAGQETDPTRIALSMEKWVHQNIKKKNFSVLMASASEVAKDLAGDCTEHAVLLAAMARVKGIPSRVSVGLVYVPQLAAFGGHMWTEVYLQGQWVPLDATLGKGVVGPDHLKFADTMLDENGAVPVLPFLPLTSVLNTLKIEVLSVE